MTKRISRRWLPALALVAALAGGCEDEDGVVGPGSSVVFRQVDRFGLPAIATVFIPAAQKDAFNQAAPAGDRGQYKDEVVAVLTTFGVDAATADQLANALLPDIQPIDVTQPTAFLNGRTLADDVVTAELGLIFGANAALNDDHVDANDRPFSNAFPYLAEPQL
jgi:hypothetical protein